MSARHGDWPWYLTYEPAQAEDVKALDEFLNLPAESRGLYDMVAGPLEPCGPDCDAMCVCDTEPEEKD